MRRLGSSLAIGIISLSLIACGDDDDEVGDSAAEKCEDALSVVCDRTVECRIQAGEASEATLDEAHETCLTEQRAAMAAAGTHCGKAIEETSSYDECLSEVPNIACSTILDPEAPGPAACRRILFFRQ